MSQPSSLDRAVFLGSDLPEAERGWLAGKLRALPGIAASLGRCQGTDELMRRAVELAKDRLGLSRLGIWLLERDGRSAVGTFGLGVDGRVVDERRERIFDNSGFIAAKMDAWKAAPHYCERPLGTLRSAEATAVGCGRHVTAPLLDREEVFGFVAVDDLIDTESVNNRTGPLLCQFAQIVSSAYLLQEMRDEVSRCRETAGDAERVQSEFLAMMGHEVRTPLNAMMGYAQLLKSRPVGDDIKDIADTIEESGKHMKGLIDSVLEYSHLSSGDVKRWYKPGDPIEVLRSTARSFEELYRAKGLDLKSSFEGRPVPVLFDAVSLRQVVSNLLQNALKFTERGGAQLRAFSRSERGRSRYFIEVKDTGIGIDAEHRRSIFEPFRQVQKQRDRAAGGIGMGLAIVKRLVEAMDGEITCRSGDDAGTVFTIDLAFEHEVEADVADGGSTPSQARADARLLIVEDDEANLEALRSMTEYLGFVNTDFARNGIEARELLAERPYDIVLLDVQLPRMDGLSLTRLVRSGEVCSCNREVPIVGVTAFTEEHDRDECLMVGMNDYLPKPIMLESLRRVMELV